MSAIFPASRNIRRRLALVEVKSTPAGCPTNSVAVDGDLAVRLSSLAVTSSAKAEVKARRLRRRVSAAIGAIGIAGWAGVAATGLSVGLAGTGNLPAPVQGVVADVLEMIRIEIPRPVSDVDIRTMNDRPADTGSDISRSGQKHE